MESFQLWLLDWYKLIFIVPPGLVVLGKIILFATNVRNRMPLTFKSTEKKIEHYKQQLKNNETPKSYKVIHEQIRQLEFFQFLGIERTKSFRNAFYRMCKKHSDSLIISDLRRAKFFLSVEDRKMVIRDFTLGDKIEKYFNIVAAVLMFFLAFFILFDLLVVNFLNQSGNSTELKFIILNSTYLVFSLGFFLMTLPPVWTYQAINRVKKAIEITNTK